MSGEERGEITEPEGAAYHEAAHTVVYHHLGLRLKQVSIACVESTQESRWTVEDQIMCHMAGRVMDDKLGRDPARSRTDWRQAYMMTGWLPEAKDAAAHDLIQRLYEKTKTIIEQPGNSAAIRALARKLIDGGTLDGPEAEQLIEEARRNAKDGGNQNVCPASPCARR